MLRAGAAVALLVIIAFASFSPATAAEPVTVVLAEQNGSGQSGTATLNPMGEQTQVIISITRGVAEVALPARIYAGSCSGVGPVVHSLRDVVNGQSSTIVNAPIEQLSTGGLAINVHFLPEFSLTTLPGSCGHIPLQ